MDKESKKDTNLRSLPLKETILSDDPLKDLMSELDGVSKGTKEVMPSPLDPPLRDMAHDNMSEDQLFLTLNNQIRVLDLQLKRLNYYLNDIEDCTLR